MKGQDFIRIVANELAKQPHINSAVSDILEGLTNGQIAGQTLGTYGHGVEYWEHPTIFKTEVVAHLFESLSQNSIRQEIIREIFPLTMERIFSNFINILNRRRLYE